MIFGFQYWTSRYWNQHWADCMSNANGMNYIEASSTDEHATDVVDVWLAPGGLVLEKEAYASC